MPVFIHRAGLVEDVVARARLIVGAPFERYHAYHEPARGAVRHGATITVESWIEGGECRPPHAVLRWLPPLVETTFEVRYLGSQPVASGGLRLFVDGVVVAETPLSLPIVTNHDVPADRVGSAAFVDAVRHRRVFASYSHRDRHVVRLLASAARVLGDEYVIDFDALRSGERWAARVEELIRTADAFELFWSTNSMRSQHVRHEWELALALNRDNFIKPVYWQEPRPEDPPSLPPPELNALHFSKLEIKRRRSPSLRRRR
jgi:hypothetical protein